MVKGKFQNIMKMIALVLNDGDIDGDINHHVHNSAKKLTNFRIILKDFNLALQ